MTALGALIRRDIRIALRVGGGALIGVLFFLTVVVLMPFAVGPDLALLARLGPAILWLGALLASLLTLDRLFTADQEDGSLDLILMRRTPLELACAAKALAHWLAAGLPLVIATPVLGLLLNLDMTATAAVALTLLVGTPALTFTGMIGAALAVTLHRGGLLLEVLVLPLSHRGKGGRRMLGSLVAMERPYWLGIWPARRLSLGVVQFVGADVYAPLQAGASASRISLRLRNALTVIDGGRSQG